MKRFLFFTLLFCILVFFSGCVQRNRYFTNISSYDKTCSPIKQTFEVNPVSSNVSEVISNRDIVNEKVQRSLVVYNSGTHKNPVLKAMAVFSDDSMVDVSDKIIWESLNPDVLEFDIQNQPIPKKNSLARVSATYEGFKATTDPFPVVYNEMDLRGVSRIFIVSETHPDSSEFLFRTYKQQLQLKALAHFNNLIESRDFVMDITEYMKWKSRDPYIVSVDKKGLLTAEGTGSASVYVDLNDDFILDENMKPVLEDTLITFGMRQEAKNKNVLLESFNVIVNIPGEKNAFISYDDGGSVVDNIQSPSIDVVFPLISVPDNMNVKLDEVTETDFPISFDREGRIVKAFSIEPEGIHLRSEATVNIFDDTFSTSKQYQVFFLSTLDNSYVPVNIQTYENGKISFFMKHLGYWVLTESIENSKSQKVKRIENTFQEGSSQDFFLNFPSETGYQVSCDEPSVNVYLQALKSADWVTFTFRETKNSFTVSDRTVTFDDDLKKQIYEEKLYLYKDEVFVWPYNRNVKRDELQDGIYHIDIQAYIENGFFSYVLPVEKKCTPIDTDKLEKIQLIAVQDPITKELGTAAPLDFLQQGESIAIWETAVFSDGRSYPLRDVFPNVEFIIEDKNFANYISSQGSRDDIFSMQLSNLTVNETGETAFWVKAGDLCSEKIPLIVENSKSRNNISEKEKRDFDNDNGKVYIRGVDIESKEVYLYDTSSFQLEAFLVFTDKDEENISDRVEWTSTKPEICAVDDKGILRAMRNGKGWINAHYNGKVAMNSFQCVVALNSERGAILTGHQGRFITENDGYTLTLDVYRKKSFMFDAEVIPHILDVSDLPKKPIMEDPILAVFSIEPYDAVLYENVFVTLNFQEWPLPYEKYDYWFYNPVRKEYFQGDAFLNIDYQGNDIYFVIDSLGYFFVTGKSV